MAAEGPWSARSVIAVKNVPRVLVSSLPAMERTAETTAVEGRVGRVLLSPVGTANQTTHVTVSRNVRLSTAGLMVVVASAALAVTVACVSKVHVAFLTATARPVVTMVVAGSVGTSTVETTQTRRYSRIPTLQRTFPLIARPTVTMKFHARLPVYRMQRVLRWLVRDVGQMRACVRLRFAPNTAPRIPVAPIAEIA